MAMSAASAIYSGASSSAQNKKQKGWNEYNANMQYGTDKANVSSQLALARVNANMAAQQSMIQQKAIKETTELNARIIAETALYNDALYEEELSMLWDSVGLDLAQMENQRAVERGSIVAQQGASGTVIGEGSNEDVIVHQQTQEAMDAFIVNHNADGQARKISNARAQSLYMGEMEIKKTLYEGSVNMSVAAANGQAQAQGALASANIAAVAGMYSANQRHIAGIQGAGMQSSMNQQQINSGMASGMFGAVSQGAQDKYRYKPTTSLDSNTTGSLVTGGGGGGSKSGASLFATPISRR